VAFLNQSKAATIGALSAILICACAGCALRPAHVNAFGQKLAWTSPHSLNIDRMVVAGRGGDPPDYCTSLWDAGGEARLVATRLSPLHLFGDSWDVLVVDRDGRVVRRGQLRCQADDIPYCLLEVNTNNGALPVASRNHWVLAIGLVGKFEAPSFDPQKPFRFFAGGGGFIDVKSANWIDVEPVQWDDEPAFTRGVEVLGQASCEVRLAERSIVRLMTQHLVRDEQQSAAQGDVKP
jgi:hypothetical protein